MLMPSQRGHGMARQKLLSQHGFVEMRHAQKRKSTTSTPCPCIAYGISKGRCGQRDELRDRGRSDVSTRFLQQPERYII